MAEDEKKAPSAKAGAATSKKDAPEMVPETLAAPDALVSAEADAGTPITSVNFDEAKPAEEVETPQPTKPAPKGMAWVRYDGDAHVARLGDHKFEPGKPVLVTQAEAEALLTTPFETFVVVNGDGTKGEE